MKMKNISIQLKAYIMPFFSRYIIWSPPRRHIRWGILTCLRESTGCLDQDYECAFMASYWFTWEEFWSKESVPGRSVRSPLILALSWFRTPFFLAGRPGCVTSATLRPSMTSYHNIIKRISFLEHFLASRLSTECLPAVFGQTSRPNWPPFLAYMSLL